MSDFFMMIPLTRVSRKLPGQINLSLGGSIVDRDGEQHHRDAKYKETAQGGTDLNGGGAIACVGVIDSLGDSPKSGGGGIVASRQGDFHRGPLGFGLLSA
jgi:hypothetical protein